MIIQENILFLDSETTGLDKTTSKMVELAIVNTSGKILLNTLINPGIPIPIQATKIHGITDEMVKDAPSIEDLTPTLTTLMYDQNLIIYNFDYDVSLLPKKLKDVIAGGACCMERFAKYYGEWNDYSHSYKWQTLIKAADHIKYKWTGTAHRALSDTLACRAVWDFLENN